MYCGDGINDLVALASADVGMAIGSSHASAAAAISDEHASVEGALTVCTSCLQVCLPASLIGLSVPEAASWKMQDQLASASQ